MNFSSHCICYTVHENTSSGVFAHLSSESVLSVIVHTTVFVRVGKWERTSSPFTIIFKFRCDKISVTSSHLEKKDPYWNQVILWYFETSQRFKKSALIDSTFLLRCSVASSVQRCHLFISVHVLSRRMGYHGNDWRICAKNGFCDAFSCVWHMFLKEDQLWVDKIAH